MTRKTMVSLLIVVASCATRPPPRVGHFEVPFLHPTARIMFPAEIGGLPIAELEQSGAREFSAHYGPEDVRLSVTVYPG